MCSTLRLWTLTTWRRWHGRGCAPRSGELRGSGRWVLWRDRGAGAAVRAALQQMAATRRGRLYVLALPRRRELNYFVAFDKPVHK